MSDRVVLVFGLFLGYFFILCLGYLFLCLFTCFLFRVCLVFISASSVMFVCVYFCVSIFWGFLGLVGLGF